MFIPPPNIKLQEQKFPKNEQGLQLKSCHLQIDAQIAELLFGSDQNAYLVYYANQRSLLIASANDKLFKSLHKVSQHMVKDRNLSGDKSIALHEMLIDNQIDQTDRTLEYEFQKELGILKVQM